MYGQVHVIVRSLVVEGFGKDAWNKILEECGWDDTEYFLIFNVYDDAATLKLIGAGVKVLGVPLETVLEVFGEHFLLYCLRHGYDKMLRTLGGDFISFIQNLDSLHALLSMSYEQMDAPSFRCLDHGDGTYRLHYYSPRFGLHHIVTGLIRAVGKELYGVKMTSEILEVETLEMGHTKQSHVVFKVQVLGRIDESTQEDRCPEAEPEVKPWIPPQNMIDAKCFCWLFPFHVIFDKDLIIKQIGDKMQTMLSLNLDKELHMEDLFEVTHPHIPFTFAFLQEFINASYIIEMDNKRVIEKYNLDIPQACLSLKGQMIWMPSVELMIFIASPRLSSLNEMMDRQFYLCDIPSYDVTRELVLLNQQRIAEIEVSKKLDEATAALKRTTAALEVEKEKTDFLLYSMLPIEVAHALKEGKKVGAEKFEQVTILFADIITFGEIAAAVQPMEIVDLLNTIYGKFDSLVEENDVYKVETIGDAYMVVSGLPTRVPDHAERVSGQAIDMMVKIKEVASPITGKPLCVRIGLHTGPVVAGVIGEKMPRYCLFGDTVNTASRMGPGHGVPDKIHLSPFTHKFLADKPGYKFQDRGEITVKGKGLMHTYFLYATPKREIYCAPLGENTVPGDKE